MVGLLLRFIYLVKSDKGLAMPNHFIACLHHVADRGSPPMGFLDELLTWGRSAPESLFLPNTSYDIYSDIVGELGPWQSAKHRRAVMMEVLRVLAGFESSWNWLEGRDVTNPKSNTECTEEAGILQCSADSMHFAPELKQLLLATGAEDTCKSFQEASKHNHPFALQYCALLLRYTTRHHGPLRDSEIHAWLRRDAVDELMALL